LYLLLFFKCLAFVSIFNVSKCSRNIGESFKLPVLTKRSKGTPSLSTRHESFIQFLFFIYGFLATFLSDEDLFIINVVSVDKYLTLS